VLAVDARLVLNGEITSGDLLVFLAYLKSAYRPIQDFTKYTGRVAKATAAGERVIELLDRVPDVRDGAAAVKAPAFAGHVQFEQVQFAYEHETPLLADINLEVKAGEHLALVGPSGSGKSTLLSLVLRLYDPQQGRVLIDGRPVRDFTLESLRGQISVVLQDNLLFAGTVRENIACAAIGATTEQIESAARLANAHEFITALPQGYDTLVGERGVTLSHGQRQRVAIARAAIRSAPILILDEPTTGLDKRSERAVLEALEKVYQGRTTFLITHDLRHVAAADRIAYLEAGRLVEQGTHEELLALNGRYAAMLRMQVGAMTEPKAA
jgi:ATP-binding cassette subfamily B protein